LNLCVRTFPAREKYGLVWACLQEGGAEPAIPALDTAPGATTGSGVSLRSIVIAAPAERVVEALSHYRFVPSRASRGAAGGDAACSARNVQDLVVACSATTGAIEEDVVFVVQPADARKSIVHGVTMGALSPDNAADRSLRRMLVRHHDERLRALRDALESAGGAQAQAGRPRELLRETA
jgi:hypothetical protein